jgi:hypothetical protein
LAAVVLSLAAGHVWADDESPFAWTYTTDLLPKGKWEGEQWVTARMGKIAGT